LESAGVGDYITLYRGISTSTGSGIAQSTATNNVAESWSVISRKASYFSAGSGNILEERIKTSRILSTGLTGFGSITEGEFVVLNDSPATK
jgi:hypothetical protein